MVLRVPARVPFHPCERRAETREDVLVAMPEQRARMLRETRSPSKIFRIGPLTVAQCLMGVMGSPSLTCHSTLGIVIYEKQTHSLTGEEDLRAAQLGKDFIEERNAGYDALMPEGSAARRRHDKMS